MADGLLDIIEPRLHTIPKKDCKTKNEYKWMKIYDMRDEMEVNWSVPFHNPNAGNELEIWGTKLNVKVDKKVDRGFGTLQAAEIINRNVKMWLAKLRCSRIKREQSTIKIQCMFRRYKAVEKRKNLKIERYYKIRENAANKIKTKYKAWKKKRLNNV